MKRLSLLAALALAACATPPADYATGGVSFAKTASVLADGQTYEQWCNESWQNFLACLRQEEGQPVQTTELLSPLDRLLVMFPGQDSADSTGGTR